MNTFNDMPESAAKILGELKARRMVKQINNGVVVYLDIKNGKSIFLPESDNPKEAIRLMVLFGKIPAAITDYKTNAKPVWQTTVYARYAPINGSLSAHGLLVFEACNGHTVYAEQRNGTDDGVGYYTGFIHLGDVLFAEYTYFSTSLDDHKNISNQVCRWLKQV